MPDGRRKVKDQTKLRQTFSRRVDKSGNHHDVNDQTRCKNRYDEPQISTGRDLQPWVKVGVGQVAQTARSRTQRKIQRPPSYR